MELRRLRKLIEIDCGRFTLVPRPIAMRELLVPVGYRTVTRGRVRRHDHR
jgi:hypothetical protein